MSFFFSLDALQALSIISVDLTAVSASLPELELRKRAGEVVVGAVGACVCACVYVCMGVCMCVCVMKVVPACKPVLPVLCAECLMLVLSVLTTVQHIGGTHSSQLQRIGGKPSSQLQRNPTGIMTAGAAPRGSVLCCFGRPDHAGCFAFSSVRGRSFRAQPCSNRYGGSKP